MAPVLSWRWCFPWSWVLGWQCWGNVNDALKQHVAVLYYFLLWPCSECWPRLKEKERQREKVVQDEAQQSQVFCTFSSWHGIMENDQSPWYRTITCPELVGKSSTTAEWFGLPRGIVDHCNVRKGHVTLPLNMHTRQRDGSWSRCLK